MDATSTIRHSFGVIFKSKLHAVCFCCVFIVIGPHAIHPCFTSNTLTFEEHPKKSALLPWLNDKPHSFQRMWCRNNARYIKIYCLCMDILLVYTHLDPSQLVLLLRNHGRFWFHCEPIERQGSPGWKVNGEKIYASNVEINSWTLLGPKTQAFFHLGNWTHKTSGNHLRLACNLNEHIYCEVSMYSHMTFATHASHSGPMV